MRNFFLILFLCTSYFAKTQPEYFLESYPTKQEMLRLNSAKEFTRASKQYLDEEDFKCEGKLKFFKRGRDIDIRPVEEWKHYFPSGKVKEAVLYDQSGNVKEVFLFSEKGAFLSDSRYHYKKLKGITYRIEKYTEYNAQGTIVKLEFWYSKISYSGIFMEISIPKKIGFWKEFDDKGTAILQKKGYKVKLAESLGLEAR